MGIFLGLVWSGKSNLCATDISCPGLVKRGHDSDRQLTHHNPLFWSFGPQGKPDDQQHEPDKSQEQTNMGQMLLQRTKTQQNEAVAFFLFLICSDLFIQSFISNFPPGPWTFFHTVSSVCLKTDVRESRVKVSVEESLIIYCHDLH